METLAKTGGIVMVAWAWYQMAAFLYRVLARKFAAARLDREFLRLLTELSASVTSDNKLLRQSRAPAWQGKRKFQVTRKQVETPDGGICSFHLSPCDHEPLPPCRPGQFLTFEFAVPGEPEPVHRCYSISDSPGQRRDYRITVKKMLPPRDAPEGTPCGVSSSHLHDNVQIGDVVEAHAPSGSFFLDQTSSRPIVMIAGGVGVTPLLAMLNWLIANGSERQVCFFYGVTNRSDHAMYDYFQAVCRAMRNVRMLVFYAHPTETCRLGLDYDVEGILDLRHMKPLLKARDYEFYVCGPPAMMESITADLKAWGVPERDILTESFQAAPPPPRPAKNANSQAETPARLTVTFSKSRKIVEWNPGAGSLLELAEDAGIKARFSCRSGNCGTCTSALLCGEVDYAQAPAHIPADGICLPCVARPKSNLMLDL